MYIKYFKALLVITSAFVFFTQPVIADVYTVVIGDTCSADISSQVHKDMKLMQKETYTIANSLSTRAHVSMWDGYHAEKNHIFNAINQISLKSDDILIFYYSGHGCRTPEKKSKWPLLHFSHYHQYVDLDEVIAFVKGQNAGFSMVIADCCNDFRMPQIESTQKFNLAFNPSKKNRLSRQIGHLFGSSRGVVVLSAAKPGELSWSTDFGGVLTLALVDELSEQKFTPQKRWDTILQQIVQKTRSVQEPQYAILY